MNMRVLHAPHNIGGQASTIAKAQRELGVESDVLVFDEGYLNYECDINLALSEKPRATALLIKLSFAHKVNEFRKMFVQIRYFPFPFRSIFAPKKFRFTYPQAFREEDRHAILGKRHKAT
jgi:hypothetical protein